MMDFSGALEQLKQGACLTRSSWNGPGQWVAMQSVDPESRMTLPYFYICTVTGSLVPWVPSISDIMAEDWGVIGEKET